MLYLTRITTEIILLVFQESTIDAYFEFNNEANSNNFVLGIKTQNKFKSKFASSTKPLVFYA